MAFSFLPGFQVAPKLGATLGLFGTAFSILADLGKPTMGDVLKSVNNAIEDLTVRSMLFGQPQPNPSEAL